MISDTNSVGKIGHLVSVYSKDYLGYLAFIYLPILIYPLYKLNFSSIENYIEKTISYTFLFITIIIFQSLIIDNDMSGKIGDIIVSVLNPYIGKTGLWISVLIGLFISLIILFEEEGSVFYYNMMEKFDSNSTEKRRKQEQKLRAKQQKEYQQSIAKEQQKEKQKVVVKEVGDTAVIKIEEQEESILNKPKFETAPSSIDNTPQQQKEEYKKDEVQIDSAASAFTQSEEIIKDEIIAEEKSTKNTVIVEELEENKKLLEDIEVGEVIIPKNFQLPPSNLFQNAPKGSKSKVNEAFIDQKMKDLIDKLKQFKIEGDVVRTYTGPIVTTFEFKPAPNVKVSKILNLQDDLAMALKAQTIRIQAPIPGKDVVGIEVPNDTSETIYLREILESELFQNASSPLTMILGKDIVGQPFITDLKKLPHLLIAGTTGSGKSVGLNSMIISLLYKNSPDNLKLIMIDPKMIEFSIYNDIPHLLTPVITKPMEAINALANMVAEMEKRYTLMAETRTKNIETYNEKVEITGKEPFPYIVIIIDELADLMMTSGKEVEISIARIAQKARACGIHLIVATQRPSVDVVTGLIKANLPSRISYKVGQKVDSKIILDSLGAESLLGRGDMLFTPPGMSGLIRIHAPWSDEKEIEDVAEFLKEQREANYDISYLKDPSAEDFSGDGTSNAIDSSNLDELYEQAKMVVIQDKKSSISYLQRRLKIGYNRSATIIEQLEQTGVLSSANAKGNREILI